MEIVIEDNVEVFGDRRLLSIVIDNLLGNAWKYTGNSDTPRIEFGVIRKNGEDIYFVRDNGVGFNMEYVDKLFGAFQRLHGKEFEGTGIGLATVQRIIKRHGGKVWAESREHEGATFYFNLPARSPAESGTTM
jgi:light-regulated signal transduction histidine kinase (bacteriophytochrome)